MLLTASSQVTLECFVRQCGPISCRPSLVRTGANFSLKKVGLAVAGTAAAGLVVLGGATLADAATKTSATSGYGHPGASNDTPVTGDELAKVTAAVKAKDSAATVTNARKDPDGSYDVVA